jgi:hypothetical protein
MNWSVSFRIHYSRRSDLAALLTLALLAAALLTCLTCLTCLAWRPEKATARNTPLVASAAGREYYLTYASVSDATHALTACASGYHMASLWEILDTSSLKYNTGLGAARDDSGQGPPAFFGGWVRTGDGSGNTSTPGQGNCNAWTSTSGNGTYARLPSDWASAKNIYVWQTNATSCSSDARVWCVQDRIVYLPLIMRNYKL